MRGALHFAHIPPTDASEHLQPHACGSEEQACSATCCRAAQVGPGLPRATWIPTRTHTHTHIHILTLAHVRVIWGSPPYVPHTGQDAHTILELCDPLRRSTILVNFLTKFILQKQKVGAQGDWFSFRDEHGKGCSHFSRLELRNPGHGIGGLASTLVKPVCWPPPPTCGAWRGKLGMLRVLQHLGVPSAPRQISDASVSTIPPQGQGQARMKKGAGTHLVCLKTASAVSTLKDAYSGLGMAHSSDRERA